MIDNSNELASILSELETIFLSRHPDRWNPGNIEILNRLIRLRGPKFTADVIGCNRSSIVTLIRNGILTETPPDLRLQRQMRLGTRLPGTK